VTIRAAMAMLLTVLGLPRAAWWIWASGDLVGLRIVVALPQCRHLRLIRAAGRETKRRMAPAC
jgi:hypothetical protein